MNDSRSTKHDMQSGGCCLVRTYPENHLQSEITLSDAPVLIGRDPNCQIVLDDDYASREHAIITKRDHGYFIQDQSSSNGTIANGVLTDECTIRDNDLIYIGNTLLHVVAYRNRRHLNERLNMIRAMTDPLTHCLRMTPFLDSLEREMYRAWRYEREFTLLCVKLMPDQASKRELNSRLIQVLARRIVSLMRRDATVARVDEQAAFVILIPECGQVKAQHVMERIAQVPNVRAFPTMNGNERVDFFINGIATPIAEGITAVDLVDTLCARGSENQPATYHVVDEACNTVDERANVLAPEKLTWLFDTDSIDSVSQNPQDTCEVVAMSPADCGHVLYPS